MAQSPTIEQAFAYCERLAKAHYENFTVASWLLPRHLRSSLFVLYAFCRHTDDLGDEADGNRIALLDDWERDLLRCYTGQPEHPVLAALQVVIRKHGIPEGPFFNLIEANRMDQQRPRYPTYGQLLDYCHHSANPVGHMVLYVFGYSDQRRQGLADATCTALQLTNFWQDIKKDWSKGRVYIPQEDIQFFGYSEDGLAREECNIRFKELLAFEIARTRILFREGLRLAPLVDGRLRVDLRLFTAGGLAILDAIEARGFDVFAQPPTISRAQKMRLALSVVSGLGGRS